MFFVTVGIAILFSSFIIALFSLIREQNERQEAAPAAPAKASEAATVVTSPAPVEPTFDAPEVPKPQAVGVLDHRIEEVFPWEAGFRNVAPESPGENLVPETTVSNQVRDALSGEISVRSLRQKAA